MKKMLTIVVIIMIMVGGIVLDKASGMASEMKADCSVDFEGQTDGGIEIVALPNEETAIEVATAIAENFVRADRMGNVFATFDANQDVWIVTFNPASEPNTITLGGETNIALAASDCRVVKVWGAE